MTTTFDRRSTRARLRMISVTLGAGGCDRSSGAAVTVARATNELSRPALLITDIKCYLEPFFMVKVETNQGLYGWGESGIGRGRGLAVRGAVEHYKSFLLGRDAMDISALWQEMYRSQYFEGGRVLTGAQSAIDLALHDIVGKALGVPVYQLLGGKHRDFVPCFPTCFLEMGPEAVADAARLRREGWDVIRFVGAGHGAGTQDSTNPEVYEPRASIDKTVKWLPKIREALDAVGHTTLILEYHHRLSVAEAASFCQKLPPGTIDALEEPIRVNYSASHCMRLDPYTPVYPHGVICAV